jgi:hypothetical protein
LGLYGAKGLDVGSSLTVTEKEENKSKIYGLILSQDHFSVRDLSEVKDLALLFEMVNPQR